MMRVLIFYALLLASSLEYDLAKIREFAEAHPASSATAEMVSANDLP